MKSIFQQPEPQKAATGRPNLTGIPTQMKLNFEQRSGMSFDDVRVHYNSDKPAQFHALAYTQGAQIYVGPGQERSLPHELGHVIQQKAGRVRPTRWFRGQPINDQPELEREANCPPAQCVSSPALWGVIQMLPIMPQQRGNNCGYHALARAIYALYPDKYESQSIDGDLEIRLTTYAIKEGYSVLGEAFDPDILAQVGNGFCEDPYCKDNGISIECAAIKITESNPLELILANSKNDNSIILVPYYPDMQTWGPVENKNREENAHWGVIEVYKTKAGKLLYNLYEGNHLGSRSVDDNTAKQPSVQPDNESMSPPKPSDVKLKDLHISNATIQPSFSWIDFFAGAVVSQIKGSIYNVYYLKLKQDMNDIQVLLKLLDEQKFFKNVQEIMKKYVTEKLSGQAIKQSLVLKEAQLNLLIQSQQENPYFKQAIESLVKQSNDSQYKWIETFTGIALTKMNDDKEAVLMKSTSNNEQENTDNQKFTSEVDFFDKVRAVMNKHAEQSKFGDPQAGDPTERKQSVRLAHYVVTVKRK